MSKKTVRSAPRPQSSRRQAAADCINRAFASRISSKFAMPLAPPPACTTFPTLRRNLGLRGQVFIARLQAIERSQTSQLF